MQEAPRVLVVDDEPKICEFLEALLHQEGYLVDRALSGAAALKKLGDSQYNLVISDVKMPGMDGFELARHVKKLNEDVPLIMMTGYSTLRTAVQALREGVDDYVTKPFKIGEMRRAVCTVLEKARLSVENRRLIGELQAANKDLTHHREALKNRVKMANEDLWRANAELRQHVGNLAMLNEIALYVASELDLDKLLQSCASLVAEKLGVTRASIMLCEDERVVVKASRGHDDLNIVGMESPLGEGIAGKVAQSGRPILVKDVLGDPRLSPHTEWGYVSSSLVCVPIISKRENLGVICATDKRSGEPFAERDVRLLSTIASQVGPAVENARLYRKLEDNMFSVVRALVAGLEAKDRFLSGHARRVTRYALEIGKAMALGNGELSCLERASQLHDLGKVGVPDLILNKPGPLTPGEYNIVKQHAELGAQIIEPLEFLREVRPAIRHHHERIEGTGYPDGLAGDEINLKSRIISVADAFDAMTSPRPYRPAKDANLARYEIYSLRGKQFDAEIADIFCDQIDMLKVDEIGEHEKPASSEKPACG